MQRSIRLITLTGICLGLISGADAQERKQLPGAKGPRLERPEQPPAGIELVDARVADGKETSRPDPPPSATFSSGVAELRLSVELKSEGPPKVNITFEVFSDTGKIKIKDGYAVYSAVPADRSYSASYPLEPEAGKYANGAYQLKLLMDGKGVALLNWSVGEQ